jgi:hypothetical protein
MTLSIFYQAGEGRLYSLLKWMGMKKRLWGVGADRGTAPYGASKSKLDRRQLSSPLAIWFPLI